MTDTPVDSAATVCGAVCGDGEPYYSCLRRTTSPNGRCWQHQRDEDQWRPQDHMPTTAARRCKQELCPNWSGDGLVCPCALFDLDTPDDPYGSLAWANGEPSDD